jgi:O-antigen/teichoic acid export membrane protein
MSTTASLPRSGSSSAQPVAAPHAGSLLRDGLRVGGATVVGQALGMATSLLLRGLLDPAAMGVWQGLKLALSYGNYASFGVSKAATREWSIAQGSGQRAEAAADLNVAFAVNLLTSGTYGLILAVAAIVAALRGGPWAWAWSSGLLCVALLVILQRHVTFHVSILRAEGDFRATARLSVLESVATLVAAGTAAWCWGLPGLYAGTLLVLLAAWGYLKWHGARPLAWRWSRGDVHRLASAGLPMLATAALWSLLRSLDKLTILSLVPDAERQLGYYSLALLAGGQIFGLANMLGTVVVPRLGRDFGATGGTAEPARLALDATLWQAALLGPLAAAAVIVGPPLLGYLLPDYQAGLAALDATVIGAVALGLSLPAAQLLVAVRRERLAAALMLAGCVLAAALLSATAWLRPTLAHLATATACGYAAYAMLTLLTACYTCRAEGAWSRAVAVLAIAAMPWYLATQLRAGWPGDAPQQVIGKLLLLVPMALAAVSAAWLVSKRGRVLRPGSGQIGSSREHHG